MKIYQAMSNAMKQIDAIGKDAKNQAQGFKYRGIDSVYNSLHKVLSDNNIFMTLEVLERQREERTTPRGTVMIYTILRIKYTFFTDDGSSVSCTVDGEAMDSGDKSSNKCMSIAHKYALIQCFCIPTEELDDPDAEVHEISPRTKTESIKAAQTKKPKINEQDMATLIEDYAAEFKKCNSIDDLKTSLAIAWRHIKQEGEQKDLDTLTIAYNRAKDALNYVNETQGG